MKTRPRSLDAAADWLLGALIVSACSAAFAPALDNSFVRWDDGVFIIDNPHIRGLSVANLRWMLTAFLGGLWHPLVWLSLALDYSIWSLDPWGFHLTNIALHAAVAVLFYRVAVRLLGLARPRLGRDETLIGAALAALFFAVHPMRVESVAWAIERKDQLSGLFWMAALLCRLRAVNPGEARRRAWAAASVAFFALDMTAKVTGLTLPVVLLLLEIYPLKRLPADPRRWLEPAFRRVLSSLVPYLVLAAAAYAMNTAAVESVGLLFDLSVRNVAWRVGQSLYGLLFYPLKTLWPASLSPHYPPRPWFGRWSWELFACAASVLGASFGVQRLARRWPALAAAMVCYAVMLIPVSGLAQGGVAYSAFDRYSYLPTLGFAVLFGGFFAGRGRVAQAAAVVWLAALGFASWGQCAVWRDTVTLWSTVMTRAPGGFAQVNLGVALVEAGRRAEGIETLRSATRAYPEFGLAYDDLAVALYQDGQATGAIEAWRKALSLENMGDAHAHLGAALVMQGGTAEAEGRAHLETAVAMRPSETSWRIDLAGALARAGDAQGAGAQYAAALSADPSHGSVWNDWGLLLARNGRLDAAVAAYRRALYAPDGRAAAHYNLGNIYLNVGRLADAERHFREALRLDPGLAPAEVNLGNVLARRGALAEAEACYRAALKKDPGLREAGVNLAAVRRARNR